MAEKRLEMPRTQTSAPVEPASTTEDPAPARGEPENGPRPSRDASGDDEVRGDRMPAGADEPGAGL